MRFLLFIILLFIGISAGIFLSPYEKVAAQEHLIGFPDADADLHGLRPWAVFALCLVPACGALWYAFASILDRYLFRKTFIAFFITTMTFISLILIMDFQNSMSDLLAAPDPLKFLPAYYGVFLSQQLVFLLPFTILLGLLYSLGQLSASREIVAFTQTGRGIFRLLRPLVILGGLLSLMSFFLNFHLAPWAEGYRKALLQSVDEGTTSQVTNVIHHNGDNNRLWFIGGFPYDLSGKKPLVDVEISTRNDNGTLKSRLKAPQANWDRETGQWHFHNATRLLVQTDPTPEFENNLPNPLTFSNWKETPSQLIQKGLDARFLGIPGLLDWLHQNPDRSTFKARSFVTQLHYRWAQPWLCLVTVLLAVPLGISFARRSRGGTVAVAVILSGLMLFCSEVFLALGDSGQIPSIPAAWGTNAIFAFVSLLLIQRRLAGRPIFQTLRKCLGR